VLDSGSEAIKLIVPAKLPYDMLSKKEKHTLPSSTVTLQLPDLLEARWTGNATGGLDVTNETPELYRDFKVENNPKVNEPSESITRTPTTTYTIKREDFGDDPLKRKWLNLAAPGTPLTRNGEISYKGQVSRPYQYKYTWPTCTGEGKERTCTENSEIRSGTVTGDFTTGTVDKAYDMYVYNGREEIKEREYRNEIENNDNHSLKKNLYWTNEPYLYSVIRWMHHQDEVGKKDNWIQAPGQYERQFIQQASGTVTWDIENSMDSEYSQAREAARKKTNKKPLYDKAVFATDRELQKYDYPIKSGYYFNPAGSYNFTVKTVVYKQTDQDTNDHKDLVKAVIDSFRYESDLIFINNKKSVVNFQESAVNIRNETLRSKGGIFERKVGVVSVKEPNGVNAVPLLQVLDRSQDNSRYTKKVEEIQYSNKRGGDSHKFWKMVLEGYSDSYTEGSNTNYVYREYVEKDRIYKITETTKVTINVNQDNVPLYTHANMPDGTQGDHTYKILKLLNGIDDLDSIQVTVVGSMFDDLNN
jgi:hypothetical protein